MFHIIWAILFIITCICKFNLFYTVLLCYMPMLLKLTGTSRTLAKTVHHRMLSFV